MAAELTGVSPGFGYRIKLDAGTLDLMVREGQWLQARGLAKGGGSAAAHYLKAFAPEALKSRDARCVTLPN